MCSHMFLYTKFNKLSAQRMAARMRFLFGYTKQVPNLAKVIPRLSRGVLMMRIWNYNEN